MVVESNRSVDQAQILPLPTIRGEPVILRLEFKERVQRRLTRHLSCRVLEIELHVKIVGIARQHLKAGRKIPISRFNQEEAFAGVIFRPEGAVSVEFPKLVMVVGTCSRIWVSF